MIDHKISDVTVVMTSNNKTSCQQLYNQVSQAELKRSPTLNI